MQRATHRDFTNYLAKDILVKIDRASLLNSLKARAPLPDYRWIEFAFGKVPSQLKTTPTDRKILLKRLVRRMLPPEFDCHRKQGFSIPLAKWLMSGSFKDLFNSVLFNSSCIFDQRALHGLLRGQA